MKRTLVRSVCSWLAVVLVLGCNDGAGEPASVEVLHGPDSALDSTTSTVSLMRGRASVCSGTVIARNRVLTAAHCAGNFATLEIEGSWARPRVAS